MSTSSNAAPNAQEAPPQSATNPKNWREIVRRYQDPCLRRASWQIATSIGPYVLLWYLLYLTRGQSWWITGALAVLAGLFLVRIFIIFHDCGHGSFFRSKRANDILGIMTGILTFTPYHHWRWEHAVHHAGAGHLERRGRGDIWTLTVDEYNSAPKWKRAAYHFVRHPLVIIGLLPFTLFVIAHRIPAGEASKRDRASVHWTNFALLVLAAGMSLLFGVVPYLLIQLVVIMVGGGLGVWLFYVQHQFEDVYWETGENWDFAAAALEGSSYYKLPKILQWFSGNIGFHHIHHLSSRIPNYHLERAHHSEPLFQSVKPITLLGSLKTLNFRLWDPERRKLVGFRQAREKRRAERDSGLAS
jgi:omega-6 fatty acid desaturase (delta-12 desaturase)